MAKFDISEDNGSGIYSVTGLDVPERELVQRPVNGLVPMQKVSGLTLEVFEEICRANNMVKKTAKGFGMVSFFERRIFGKNAVGAYYQNGTVRFDNCPRFPEMASKIKE